jgi:hypothetical protein
MASAGPDTTPAVPSARSQSSAAAPSAPPSSATGQQSARASTPVPAFEGRRHVKGIASPHEEINPGSPRAAQRAIKFFVQRSALLKAALDHDQINGRARQQGLQEPPFAEGRGFEVILKKGTHLFQAITDKPRGTGQNSQLDEVLKGKPALGRFVGVCPPGSACEVRSFWAVRPDWKPSLSHCVTLHVDEDATAIVGMVAPQSFHEGGRTQTLPGGGLQVWFSSRNELAKCSPVGLKPIAQR